MRLRAPRCCSGRRRPRGAGSTSRPRASAVATGTPVRGGTVAGEHSVILAGPLERLVLAHSAEDRMIFAHGAVRGAGWLIGREAGRYTMGQVLGL